jgi:hypothetical protein
MGDSDRWAARVGWVVPGVWQLNAVHTGDIVINVQAHGYWRATAHLELTGEHNDVTGAITGPFSGSGVLRSSPVPRPGNPWPFGSAHDAP